MIGAGTESQRAHIFISYKRNSVDEHVARGVFEALSQQHDVFIDQESIEGGANWARRIEAEIRKADFFIVFLSSASILSEMLVAEVELAHFCAKERTGCPIIIPVRLAFRDRLQYPLSAYLNHRQWLSWQDDRQTPYLIEQIRKAINYEKLSEESHQPEPNSNVYGTAAIFAPLPSAQLEIPGGAVDPQSIFYVMRSGDLLTLSAIRQQQVGVTITIKGPRQVGKSSLLVRVAEAAFNQEKKVALLSFQPTAKTTLTNVDLFYRQFCELLSRKLNLKSRVKDYWNIDMPLDDAARCTLYLEDYILPEVNGHLLIAMDEVDTLFDTDFYSEFFSMLRSWHESRAYAAPYKQLDLALVTSTEPYQFIKDLTQSPFNVGFIVEPEDFTAKQVVDLIQRHQLTFSDPDQQSFLSKLGGHPYLVRRGLFLVASGSISIKDLLESAIENRGPFGDHLRYYLFRLHDKKDLVDGLMQVINFNKCGNDQIAFRLQSAGLVRVEGKNQVSPRCQLYADYFKEHLQ